MPSVGRSRVGRRTVLQLGGVRLRRFSAVCNIDRDIVRGDTAGERDHGLDARWKFRDDDAERVGLR